MAYASSFSMDYHSLPLALLILLWGVVSSSSSSFPLPAAAFDWRDYGVVTPVKNQLVCDHSWAFAAVSVVESALIRNTGQQRGLDLSEQQVLDCSKGRGSLGCITGTVFDALNYTTTRGGLFRERQYPYNGVSTGVCRQPPGTLVPTLGLQLSMTLPSSENELADALVRHGPGVVTIRLLPDLVTYHGGIYNVDGCNGTNSNNAIAMTLVGYGTDQDGVDYWILKNSWGTLWGEGGYFKLARGYHMCEILTHYSYFLRHN